MSRSSGLNFAQRLRRFIWKHPFWWVLYDRRGLRTITIPVDNSQLGSAEMRNEFQLLENEVAHTSTGHRHDGADAKHLNVGTPTTLDVGDSSSAGSADTYSANDHRHGGLAAGTPVTQALGDVAAEGSATTISRSDHRHGMPAQPAGEDIPTGAIILWTGSGCPSGYTRVTALDNKFLVSSSSYNSTGGADTLNPTGTIGSDGAHSHGSVSHSHSLNTGSSFGSTSHCSVSSTISPGGDHNAGFQGESGVGGSPTGDQKSSASNSASVSFDSQGSHDHSLSVNSIENRPAFSTILLCKKN